MTKAKVKTPESEIEDAEELLYTAEELNPALDALYAELGITGDPDTTVHVAKIDADGKGNDANVWKGDPEQYDLESLAKKFGSGSYRVMVYVKIPTGQKVRKVNKVLAWLLSPEDEQKRQLAMQMPVTLPPVQQTNQPDIAGMMATMIAAMQASNKELILALAPKEKDPLTTLQGIKELAGVLVPAVQPQRDGFMDTMKAVGTFLEMQKQLTPAKVLNEDGEVSIPGLVMEGIKALKDMKQAQPAPIANNIAELPAAQVISAEQEEIEEMNLLLRLQLKQANRAAAAGDSAEEYAESIYGIIPDDVLKMVAFDPNWFVELQKLAPEVGAYPAWYMQLGAKIKAMAIEDGIQPVPLTVVQPPADTTANIVKADSANNHGGTGNAG